MITKASAACEVAPFVMSCCLDPADVVHVVRTKLTERFVADLAPLVEEAPLAHAWSRDGRSIYAVRGEDLRLQLARDVFGRAHSFAGGGGMRFRTTQVVMLR